MCVLLSFLKMPEVTVPLSKDFALSVKIEILHDTPLEIDIDDNTSLKHVDLKV